MTELMEVKGCLNMLTAGADYSKYQSKILSSPPEKFVPSEQAQQTFVVKIRDK